MKILILALLCSCALRRVIFEGKGISMTKEAVMPGECLRDLKKFQAKKCLEPFSEKPREPIVEYLVSAVQKAYKADFLRNFEVVRNEIHPFKTCYEISGIASRIEKQ